MVFTLDERFVSAGEYEVYASYFGPSARTALLLHGGGNTSSQHIHPLRTDLAERGIGTLAVDHLGHGKTGGDVGKSSLQKRVHEVLSAIAEFRPTSLLGSVSMSMGGHIALKLQQELQFQRVVLIAPAIYNTAAYDLDFADGFTEVIRQPNSWRQSDVWDILRQFSGKLVTLVGENDAVIPDGVLHLIRTSTNLAEHTFIELEGVDHFVMTRLRAGCDRRLETLLNTIADTLRGEEDRHPQQTEHASRQIL